MGVTSDVVMPRDVMYYLADSNPRNFVELAGALHDFPWRLEHFGAEILDALLAS
jgi:ribonuclease D